MKNGDGYLHCKGGIYIFDCIALPLNNRTGLTCIGTARYHENTHDLKLYKSVDGVFFIEGDLPFVLYKSYLKDDKIIWAREVDDYFGYKDGKKRFLLIR